MRKQKYAFHITPISSNFVDVIKSDNGSVTIVPQKSFTDGDIVVQLVEINVSNDNTVKFGSVIDERRLIMRPNLGNSRRKIQVKGK